MPDTPDRPALDAAAVEEAERKINAAHRMVVALCKARGTDGAREWIMSIPARPDHDPDIVISDGLMAGDKLLAEVRRLREECEGRGKMIIDITDKLRACCDRHHLGLGGDHLSDLVCERVDELTAERATIHDDIAAVLEALGLGGHARPQSAHSVVRDEIIPAILALAARTEDAEVRADGAESDLAAARAELARVGEALYDMLDLATFGPAAMTPVGFRNEMKRRLEKSIDAHSPAQSTPTAP